MREREIYNKTSFRSVQKFKRGLLLIDCCRRRRRWPFRNKGAYKQAAYSYIKIDKEIGRSMQKKTKKPPRGGTGHVVNSGKGHEVKRKNIYCIANLLITSREECYLFSNISAARWPIYLFFWNLMVCLS